MGNIEKSNLWMRDSYTRDDLDYIISKKITEYDMKDAGFNLSKYYGLLSSSKLNYLSSLEKRKRIITIGIWMRDDINFNKELTESFGKMRKLFIDANNLIDDDILTIKKDAIFVISKQCDQKSYGNVSFCEKNVYSSYHRFDNVEMFYKYSDNKIDIKGIDNDLLYQHKFMLNILKRLFRFLETNNQDNYVKFMKKFVNDYKNCLLSYDYYRELNSKSLFALKGTADDSKKYYLPNIVDNSFDNDLDISYNYMKYILPMIQRFHFSFGL